MKKIILTLAVVVGLGTLGINAQDLGRNDKKLSFGVKAEANLSNHLLSDFDNTKSKLGFGASLGGFMKYDLHKNFAIQPEIMFHYKTSKLEDERLNTEMDFDYWGVEIPVYAVGQMDMWNGRGYLGIGPYVGFGFSAEYDDVDQYEKINGNREMQRWDFGAGAMLGYEFNFGLQINAGYKIGFIDALDNNKDNTTMLNQTISLGLAYRF